MFETIEFYPQIQTLNYDHYSSVRDLRLNDVVWAVYTDRQSMDWWGTQLTIRVVEGGAGYFTYGEEIFGLVVHMSVPPAPSVRFGIGITAWFPEKTWKFQLV